jgi:hypothetical protein
VTVGEGCCDCADTTVVVVPTVSGVFTVIIGDVGIYVFVVVVFVVVIGVVMIVVNVVGFLGVFGTVGIAACVCVVMIAGGCSASVVVFFNLTKVSESFFVLLSEPRLYDATINVVLRPEPPSFASVNTSKTVPSTIFDSQSEPYCR